MSKTASYNCFYWLLINQAPVAMGEAQSAGSI